MVTSENAPEAEEKVGIMQPYLLPYIGYFQLINAVNKFVIYDNIQFTKKGWFHRNRVLVSGNDWMFTVPLKKDSDFLDVKDRNLSDNSLEEVKKILRTIERSYQKAPEFHSVIKLIEEIFLYDDKNLFNYIFNSIKVICDYLDISSEKLVVSSTVSIDHSLKAQEKVIAICKTLNADVYINPIGGVELYDKKVFSSNNVELKFIKPHLNEYRQFRNDFIPSLSIIDVLMFNPREKVKGMLNDYELI